MVNPSLPVVTSLVLTLLCHVIAVGLVILLWDHILTFPDEVQFIWKAKLSMPKVLFMFNRYLVPLAMIAQTHEFSGITPYLSLSVSACKVWYAISVAVGMLSIATSNFLILLRLWVLWDRSPRLMLGTLTFFVVTQLVALSFAGYVIYDILPMLFFDRRLRICVPMSKSRLFMLWCPGIAFEFMIFLTTMWNALDRPRSHSAKMSKIMYRDGSVYFFALFALRLVNLLLSVVAPLSLMFLGVFFIWSVSNITLARLILNLRRESSRIMDEMGSDPKSVDCDGEPTDEQHRDDEAVMEQSTELPVLRREVTSA